MKRHEFSSIRSQVEKTQHQMAQLLGTSLKAVQSFEQGWRNIPVHIERQVLYLLVLKKLRRKKGKPCWWCRDVLWRLGEDALPGSFRWDIFVG